MPLRVVDSHTGGEPTRLVVEGLPELAGSVDDRLRALREGHDWVRTSLCLEPRGSEAAVGAALFPPSLAGCTADVVFFNNEGYLGMCGHGTIGIVATLAWMGRLTEDRVVLNTVAGPVTAERTAPHTVRFDNVPARRLHKGVAVNWGGQTVVGDVAYGGNWFFLTSIHGQHLEPRRIPELTDFASGLMDALWEKGVTGDDGVRIDHVELFGPPTNPACDSRNFVLCPGRQYDRSPCGTGTSAKLACLWEDGRLQEGQVWRQESIIGSVFEGSVRRVEGHTVPSIQGTAFVTGDMLVVVEPDDPLGHGILSRG